jgi:hypothetical protein
MKTHFLKERGKRDVGADAPVGFHAAATATAHEHGRPGTGEG